METCAVLLAPAKAMPRRRDARWWERVTSFTFITDHVWTELQFEDARRRPAGAPPVPSLSGSTLTTNAGNVSYDDGALFRSADAWARETWRRWHATGGRATSAGQRR